MARKSLAEEIAEINSNQNQDIDPELWEDANPDSDSDESVENDENLAREHYAPVGKSRLRMDNHIEELLHAEPKYQGQRVERKQVLGQVEDWERMASDNEENEEMESKKFLKQSYDDSEDSGSEASEESLHNEDPLTAELQQLEQQDKIMLKKITENASEDIEKGRHTKNLLSCYDALLDIRIRSQRCLNQANQLPNSGFMNIFMESNPQGEVKQAQSQLKGQLVELMESLLTLKGEFIQENVLDPASDEEKKKLDAICQKRRDLKRKAPEDLDLLAVASWQEMNAIDRDFLIPYRDETIDKWHRKIHVSSSASLLNKKLKVLNQNPTDQIRQLLGSDKDRLIKRTQVNRQLKRDWLRVEKPQQQESEKPSEKESDPYLFDDNDFYSMLLRELIDSKVADSSDSTFISMQWAKIRELQRKNKKQKDGVDRKASKGRKIRHQVHEKLVNFMVPRHRGTWHDEMIDEICATIPTVFCQ